ncbi:Sterol 3-beta-glucosyltransferase UGT80A2-like protein [Drosera capensis]
MASSSSSKKEIRRGIAVFMAFGTKGDVYPIAAICAGFARDRSDYEVVFVTHSAHQDLAADLMTENVGCALVSSPPDPVTGLPFWHDRPPSPLLLYGFSREVVECPDYWPLNARVCGFWHLPPKWQFSCNSCKGNFDQWQSIDGEVCSMHTVLQSFLSCSRAESMPPIFICLSSIGRMGFLKNSLAFLCVLQAVLEASTYRFILLSSGYEPLERAIRNIAVKQKHPSDKQEIYGDCIVLFSGRLLCFSGSVPYIWLFPRCAAAVHHGGSGSTAAALQAGIPQVICPFILDQFYWAERMSWIGVAPEPLKRHYLLPEQSDEISIREGASELSSALSYALSSEVRTRAQQISERITHEDGVSEAARILKEEIACHDTHEE